MAWDHISVYDKQARQQILKCGQFIDAQCALMI